MGNTYLREAEAEAIKNTIKAMSQEELEVAVACMHTDLLWDELRRREREAREFRQRLEEYVYNR